MIEENDKFVECSVVMSQTDKPSNIKKIDDKIQFVEKSTKGINYKVEFFLRTNEGDKVVASTEPTQNIVLIGHDFIWKFCDNNTNIKTVNVIFNNNGNPKVKNGYVVVNPVVKKFDVSALQAAFDAGRKQTYDVSENQWDFEFANFNDWYNLKNDKK